MFAVIFGRPGCPYCVRAKQIAEQLTEQRDDFKFRYVDIHAEGITKEDLAKSAGKQHRKAVTKAPTKSTARPAAKPTAKPTAKPARSKPATAKRRRTAS